MAKLILNDVNNLTNESSAITTMALNNRAIETAITNTLSRDGTSPNPMQADLDMNSNQILNLPDALTDQEPATLGQLKDYTSAITNGAVLDASYVTLGSNPLLQSERVLTGSSNVSITDNGPGNAVTVSISDNELNALATTTAAADTIPYYNGATTATTTSLTSFGRSLIDDVDATTARTTIGLNNVDNTSDATKNAAVATLTNKTVNLTSNTLTGTTAQFNTALSDNDFATLAGTETLTNKTLTSPVISTISNTGTVTLPTGTRTLVARDTTDTLTNKTISGASNTISAVPVSGLASQAAYTFVGNNTGSAASPSAVDIAGLTTKGSPAGTDYVIISDQAASGAWKKATVSSVGASAGVSTIDSVSGAFTTSNGITSTGSSIQLTSARRTLPTIQAFTSGSGTYTLPANCLWIEVEAVAGGGGGSGSGTSNGVGGTGGNTTFGTTFITCNGGSGGQANDDGGAGGSASGGDFNINGSAGSGTSAATGTTNPGGAGAPSPLGNGGGGGGQSRSGGAATGFGAGGGGAGCGAAGNTGNGGGSGGYARKMITSPSSTYAYSVGAAGSAGTAGTGGAAGGAGSPGYIRVIEHYGT
jgi:hypothetical protein